MKRIFKYEVGRDGQVATVEGNFTRILSVQSQGGSLCAWIECDDDAPIVSVDIVAFGTGWELPTELMADMSYVGTVIDGPYVWHYYWRFTPKASGGGDEYIEVETPDEEMEKETE